MCCDVAEKFGKWPWEVYEEMPLEWLFFVQGLEMRRAEERKKTMTARKQPNRRQTMGETD